jgi:pimeloyl-ACP methyl ester carboxylesterase
MLARRRVMKIHEAGLRWAGAVLLAAMAAAPAALAEDSAPRTVASGVSYALIAEWDVDRLNRILGTDTPAFTGVDVTYTPAANAVRLYRVTYPSAVPEEGNRPIVATGLLAVPDKAGTRFPMLSYQHGTVYGKEEVPSFPEQSPETQLAIAQFAGQGYVVIGADYFGMGDSTEPEGYVVKASHQQACADMLEAAGAVLGDLKIDTANLFLAGWSQGGFVTMAFLEKLEADGVKVTAAATASAPVDIFMALNGFLNFPRKIDATWVNTLFILSAFAYENYYAVPGLARSLFNDAHYEVARKVYEREPVEAADIPTDLHALIRAEYFDPQFFAASAYGRLLAANHAYRWVIETPVRNYYGEEDEVISVGLGQLAMTWQRAMGAGNDKVEAVSTGPTSHRGTFGTAVPAWKAWFDSLN